MIEHDDYETEVEEYEHGEHSHQPLARVEHIDGVRSQVRPRAQNEEASNDSSPPISFLKNMSI